MAFKYSGDKHTVGWLHTNFHEGNLDTSISIQRREVWNAAMKSNLISSLIIGIPIDPILLEESTEATNKYMVIDGKQRTLTICQFLNDEFKLSKLMRYPVHDGFDYTDKKFSDLPDEIQSRIKDRELEFIVNRPLTEDERAKLFFLWNQSVPLSSAELLRSSLGQQTMNRVQELTDHDFMATKIKITKPGRRKYVDFEILIQYAMLQSAYNENKEIGFSKLERDSFCDDLKADHQMLKADEIEKVLDYLNEAVPAKRDYLKKANLPIIFLIANLAMNENVLADRFFEWVDDTFKRLSNDGEYIRLCKSYKRSDVQGRLEMVLKSANDELLSNKSGRKSRAKAKK